MKYLVRLFVAVLWTALPVGAGVAQSGAPATPQGGDVVAGTVVSAVDGRPLPHARVTLNATEDGHQIAETTSGDEGEFRFNSIPRGRYRLSGSAAGFLASAYLHHEELATAIVTGAGLETRDLALALTPEAEIRGRVLDESGEPVEHAQVTLFRESPPGAEQPIRRMRDTQTDDLGVFDFGGVIPGRIYLVAQGKPWYALFPPPEEGGGLPYRTSVDPALQVAYPLTYYPNGHRPEEASALEVHAGEMVTADFQLIPEPGVSLSVHLPASQPGQVVGFPLLQESIFGYSQPVSTQSEINGENMRLFGMAAGQYQMQILRGGTAGFSGGVSLDLSAGSATADLTTPAPAAQVRVSVHASGSGDLPRGLQVSLQRVGADAGSTLPADDHGTATFTSVPFATYRVEISGPARLPPVQEVRVSGRLTSDRRVHVQGTDPITVDVTLALHRVRIEGLAQRDGKPAVATLVVLVPAGAETSAELFRRDQTDLDGGFRLPDVAPGDYVLVAIDEGWALRWTDTATMLRYLPRGVAVTVPANGGEVLQMPGPVLTQPR